MTTTTDFQVSIAVQSSPADAFDKVTQVRDWWTNDIEGSTAGPGSIFTVRFADTSVEFQISEFVPGETVSWLVTNCYLPWLDDKNEWTGTTVRFDIAPSDSGSTIVLTHLGLQPELECFESCSGGWQHFVAGSLNSLIQTGSGTPMGRGLHATLSVPSTAAEVFEAICKVPEWWSADFEGKSRSVGDTFTVRFGDRHRAECKLTELTLGQRIVWDVIDSCSTWLKDTAEWTGTQMIWVVQQRGDAAQLTLTHKGITPDAECFTGCERGWEYFVSQSLSRLITEGAGRPGYPEAAGDTNE